MGSWTNPTPRSRPFFLRIHWSSSRHGEEHSHHGASSRHFGLREAFLMLSRCYAPLAAGGSGNIKQRLHLVVANRKCSNTPVHLFTYRMRSNEGPYLCFSIQWYFRQKCSSNFEWVYCLDINREDKSSSMKKRFSQSVSLSAQEAACRAEMPRVGLKLTETIKQWAGL